MIMVSFNNKLEYNVLLAISRVNYGSSRVPQRRIISNNVAHLITTDHISLQHIKITQHNAFYKNTYIFVKTKYVYYHNATHVSTVQPILLKHNFVATHYILPQCNTF